MDSVQRDRNLPGEENSTVKRSCENCPSFCYPHSKKGIEGWLAEDENLATDLDNERAVMDKLHERLLADGHPVRDWFYAHFHDSHTEFIGNIRFSLLGIMELKPALSFR